MEQTELDFYRARKHDIKESKEANLEENMRILDVHGIKYETRNNGSIVLIRLPGKPKVDFFPTTNRWKVLLGKQLLVLGDANKLIEWLKDNHVSDTFCNKEDKSLVYTDWNIAMAVAKKEMKVLQVVKGGWVIK